VDTKAWMADSAKAFAAHIDATFNGAVFRVGNAATTGAHTSIVPMVGIEWQRFGGGAKHGVGVGACRDLLTLPSSTQHTAQLFEADAVLATVFQDHPQWHFIDQRRINAGRESLYNDDLHYNGPLSLATIQEVLNKLCPEGSAHAPGKRAHTPTEIVSWARTDLAHHVVVGRAGDEAVFYFVSGEGYGYRANVAGVGQQKDTAKQCAGAGLNRSDEFGGRMPAYLKQYPLVRLAPAELQALYQAKAHIPYYCPGVALQLGGDRTVMALKEGGGLRYFSSGAEFVGEGREWDQIVHLSRWELHVLAGTA